MRTSLRVCMLTFLMCLSSSATFADAFVNMGFETGDFTGWSTIGDTLVVTSRFGAVPAGGTYQALISNAPSLFGDVQNPGYPFINGTYSGTASVRTRAAGGPSTLESFLGLPAGSFSNTFEGSAIRQSFTANVGDVLSFNFNYLSDDGPLPFGDFAFVVLDGSLGVLSPGSFSGCANYPQASSPTGFNTECGYQPFSTTLATGGTHYVAVGVVDGIQDSSVNSAVLVDNFSVTALPEPGTWLLLGSALIGLVLYRSPRSHTCLLLLRSLARKSWSLG